MEYEEDEKEDGGIGGGGLLCPFPSPPPKLGAVGKATPELARCC